MNKQLEDISADVLDVKKTESTVFSGDVELTRADQWLHVESVSPASAGGRGLSIGSVHDAQGRSLATLTQDCLMAYAD